MKVGTEIFHSVLASAEIFCCSIHKNPLFGIMNRNRVANKKMIEILEQFQDTLWENCGIYVWILSMCHITM